MTDKQLTGLRTTLTGAALFIGGALIPEPNGGLGMLSMLAGLILMLAEAVGKVLPFLMEEELSMVEIVGLLAAGVVLAGLGFMLLGKKKE